MKPIIVTGTDTNIGKTTCAAMLTLALDGYYWKPLQCGDLDRTDRMKVAELTELPPERFLPEFTQLAAPQSPQYAAEVENRVLDVSALQPPTTRGQLIIEGAGGLMVPINPSTLFIDLFAKWQLPVVLCARTALGTMNHTLLSIEAIRARNIPLLGIIFIGTPEPKTQRIIAAHSQSKILGNIPPLKELNRENLEKTFTNNFHREDFAP